MAQLLLAHLCWSDMPDQTSTAVSTSFCNVLKSEENSVAQGKKSRLIFSSSHLFLLEAVFFLLGVMKSWASRPVLWALTGLHKSDTTFLAQKSSFSFSKFKTKIQSISTLSFQR